MSRHLADIASSLRTALTHRWAQYLYFWAFSFLVLSRYFAYDGTVGEIDLIYTALFHLSLAFCVCVNSYLLIPVYFARRNYLLYMVLAATLMVVSTWVNIATFRWLADWIFPGYYFISYYEWYDIIQFMVAYTAITTLLQLSRGWFREAEVRQELAEVERRRVQTELKALKSQINPHFLFNSLNHIYAMAVQRSPETAPAVLQLSDLLRYTIRNMNRETVPLEGEIAYLEQYVELYRSRIHHPDRVSFTVEGDPGEHDVAPLLLIVFVENCFKHGSVSREGDRIEITLDIRDGRLRLETRNSVEGERELPEEEGGLGLENARRRLQLLYPQRHRLEMNPSPEHFKLVLELDLKSKAIPDS
ncbi:MAG: histidine kinase [Balneolaceae bacterium]|nr:histidine kinase [Balneolaceae bacterium]